MEILKGKNFQKSEMPTHYVYIWFRSEGVPFYVGAGKNSRYKSYQRRNSHTLNLIKKLGGIMNIQKQILPVKDQEEAFALEKALIAQFGRSDLGDGPLTNQTDGGEGTTNKIISQYTRDAVSSANKQRTWSKESRDRMSQSLKGRKVSKKTRELLSKAFFGKKRPAQIIRKMHEGHRKAVAEGRHNTDARKRAFKEIVQPAAALWHGSEEGKGFHKRLAVTSWEKRKGQEKECEFCGQKFTTPYPTRAKYCHDNCKASALRKRRGMVVGTRPDRKKNVSPRQWKTKL